MFVNNANFDDAKKYLQGTYVKFKETGDHIWHVDSVSPHEMICSDKNKEEVGIDLNIGYNFEYILPRKAVFQYGASAVILYRIPARQWKKGLCKANTNFSILTEEGSWLLCPFDINPIEGFVNKPSYYSLSLAESTFKQDSSFKSVALTPRISMCRTGKVFIDQILVAKADLEKKELMCKPIFKTDLAPVFSSYSLKVI
jgi:hypothetical protein